MYKHIKSTCMCICAYVNTCVYTRTYISVYVYMCKHTRNHIHPLSNGYTGVCVSLSFAGALWLCVFFVCYIGVCQHTHTIIAPQVEDVLLYPGAMSHIWISRVMHMNALHVTFTCDVGRDMAPGYEETSSTCRAIIVCVCWHTPM